MSPFTPDAREIVEALLRQHAPVAFQAFGPSMNPTILDGDVVSIHPLDANAVRRGSVVLFRICGRIAVHRVVSIDKRTQRIFAVGDAAVAGGDWIPADDVLGVAESARRGETVHRMDTRRARWGGLLRFYLRPLRRGAVAVCRAFQ